MCPKPKIINKITVSIATVNVLQILTITTVAFVLFSILWVTKVETYLENRERQQHENQS
jgi:hypothetical protein